MSLATAVMIAGSSARSIAGRGGRPGGGERRSATASWASVAEPPLPSASSAPPASKEARRAAAAATSASRFSVSVCCAQGGHLVRLHQHRAADVLEHGVEVVLLLRQEGVEERRAARVVRRPGRAPLQQAAVVEEHVHQLPEHVVEGLGQLLAHERVGAGGHDVPGRAGRAHGDGQAAPPRGAREGLPRVRVGRVAADAHGDVLRPRRAGRARPRAPGSVSAIAGRARLPTITGCTNSTATWRASERAPGVAPSAIRRPPRAKRSAIAWQRRAIRAASAVKNSSSALTPPVRASPPPRASRAAPPPPRRCGRS